MSSFVLKGPELELSGKTADHNYRNLYQQLVSDGVMVSDGSEYLMFKDDYAFSSPSAAAAVVYGRAASGRPLGWSRVMAKLMPLGRTAN